MNPAGASDQFCDRKRERHHKLLIRHHNPRVLEIFRSWDRGGTGVEATARGTRVRAGTQLGYEKRTAVRAVTQTK